MNAKQTLGLAYSRKQSNIYLMTRLRSSLFLINNYFQVRIVLLGEGDGGMQRCFVFGVFHDLLIGTTLGV